MNSDGDYHCEAKNTDDIAQAISNYADSATGDGLKPTKDMIPHR